MEWDALTGESPLQKSTESENWTGGWILSPPCSLETSAEVQRVRRVLCPLRVYGSSPLLQRLNLSRGLESQCFRKRCPGGQVPGPDIWGCRIRADLQRPNIHTQIGLWKQAKKYLLISLALWKQLTPCPHSYPHSNLCSNLWIGTGRTEACELNAAKEEIRGSIRPTAELPSLSLAFCIWGRHSHWANWSDPTDIFSSF